MPGLQIVVEGVQVFEIPVEQVKAAGLDTGVDTAVEWVLEAVDTVDTVVLEAPETGYHSYSICKFDVGDTQDLCAVQ